VEPCWDEFIAEISFSDILDTIKSTGKFFFTLLCTVLNKMSFRTEWDMLKAQSKELGCVLPDFNVLIQGRKPQCNKLPVAFAVYLLIFLFFLSD
jgi:hypothetical protein